MQGRIATLAFTADLLTFSRLLFAVLLVWLGTQGPSSLRPAILAGTVAWTTDQLDGWAARRARTVTHLAPYDWIIDTVLYAGTLAYLALAGFVPVVGAAIFAAVALTIGLIFRRKAVQILCVRIIDLAVAVVIFTRDPLIGWLLVAWLAILTVIYRRRLAERVPRWLAELGRLLHIDPRRDRPGP